MRCPQHDVDTVRFLVAFFFAVSNVMSSLLATPRRFNTLLILFSETFSLFSAGGYAAASVASCMCQEQPVVPLQDCSTTRSTTPTASQRRPCILSRAWVQRPTSPVALQAACMIDPLVSNAAASVVRTFLFLLLFHDAHSPQAHPPHAPLSSLARMNLLNPKSSARRRHGLDKTLSPNSL